MGPIPWADVDRYAANVLGVTCDDDEVAYDDFRHAVRSCDEVFLEVQHQKAKRAKGK